MSTWVQVLMFRSSCPPGFMSTCVHVLMSTWVQVHLGSGPRVHLGSGPPGFRSLCPPGFRSSCPPAFRSYVHVLVSTSDSQRDGRTRASSVRGAVPAATDRRL
ncbi:hypothetical protein EYF80_011000 [Liparis tanakae]|uniref:Uncharacterized protein n=1 Tax=Liparis tanakae TaxID=230148 RepID=A0A4Z2ILA3_9TELE|nr:hypothetical protein EYF80_011000 [Liparis tanakae]